MNRSVLFLSNTQRAAAKLHCHVSKFPPKKKTFGFLLLLSFTPWFLPVTPVSHPRVTQCVPSKKGDKRTGRWADGQVNCSPRFRARAAVYKCFLQLHLFSWDQPPALHRCPYHLLLFNGKICLYWILPQLSDFSNSSFTVTSAFKWGPRFPMRMVF